MKTILGLTALAMLVAGAYGIHPYFALFLCGIILLNAANNL